MNDPITKAISLQNEALRLPYGQTRIALLEEAVQLADSVNDLMRAFDFRMDLVTAATFSGRSDILLVAFSWCLAMFDRYPERFRHYRILPSYKWVAENVVRFPGVSRERLEELMKDFERRYRDSGSSMHAVANIRVKLMMSLGEHESAREAHEEWRKYRVDSLSDCRACVISCHCSYHRFQEEWQQAVDAAGPVLRGEARCAEEPHITFATLLLPLLRLGRLEEAQELHQRGYRLVSRGGQFVHQHADHLQFLALTGTHARCKSLLERHLPVALQAVEQDACFAFLLAARLWTDRLLAQGKDRLKLHLPPGLPEPGSDEKTDVRELSNWLTAKAQEIATRFDARNRTNHFQRQLDELPELLKLGVF